MTNIIIFALIVLGACVFIPIIYIAIKSKPEDFLDDNDPKNWDLIAHQERAKAEHERRE